MTLRFDFRFLETRYELDALRAHLDLVEGNLPVLQQLEISSAWHELRDDGSDDDEAEVAIKFYEVDERVQRIYPRYFRGSFLLMLSAVLESGLEEVAHYMAEHCQIDGLKSFDQLDRRRGESFLDRMRRYFREHLEVPMRLSARQVEKLALLYRVRNRLAHGNGRASSPRQVDLFAEWEELGVGISVSPGGTLDFSREYVEDAYSVVYQCLEQLMEDAKALPS